MTDENQLIKSKIENLLNSEDKNSNFKNRVEAEIKEIDFDFERNCINKLIVYFKRADMKEVIINNRPLIGRAKDIDAMVKKITRIIVDKTSRPNLLLHAK